MAYQLKTTGIAANCIQCVAVDPDTDTVKDFAGGTLAVGANVTTGTLTGGWDGNTRKYWRMGAGGSAADKVTYSAGAPNPNLSGANAAFTIVFICQMDQNFAQAQSEGPNNYLQSRTSGSDHPYLVLSSTGIVGSFSQPTSGQKVIFGVSIKKGTSWETTFYTALHDASAMSKSSGSEYVGESNVSWGGIAGNDFYRDYICAALMFNVTLTEAQWDSLRDDWFGTLLESATASSIASLSGKLQRSILLNGLVR